MQIEFNGQKKRIPDKDLQRIIDGLEITKEEAIQIWLEDEGLIINPEQEELERKGRECDILRTIHDAESATVTAKKMAGTKTRKPRTVKPQPDKEAIISQVAEALSEQGATNIVIENPTKIVTFDYNGSPYKINLTATREKKK